MPVPGVDTLAELNARIEAADLTDDARRIANRTTTVGQDFEAERSFLRLLPDEPFEAGLTLHPLIDRFARITVRQAYYSVPSSSSAVASGSACGLRRSSCSTAATSRPPRAADPQG